MSKIRIYNKKALLRKCLNYVKTLVLSGNAFTCKTFPLEKQSTGLFFNSPFAKHFSGYMRGFAPLPTGGAASGLR